MYWRLTGASSSFAKRTHESRGKPAVATIMNWMQPIQCAPMRSMSRSCVILMSDSGMTTW